MKTDLSEQICIPSNDRDQIWEIFHENSKVSRHECIPPDDFLLMRMNEMHEALHYDEAPKIPLTGEFAELRLSLAQSILSRVTEREMEPCVIDLKQLSTLFHYAYGITRKKEDTGFPRSFRTVPSGGALYPLELYFHSRCIQGLDEGLYHYNPVGNVFEFILPEDLTKNIADALTPVQSNLAYDCGAMLFITGLFERETFKYGPRGYRFTFLEAGHVAQNINLVSTSLGLGNVNICGYFDREIDDLLGIDGLTHSTIYIIGIGAHRG